MTAPMGDLTGIKTLGQCSPPCVERLMAIVENEFSPARTLGGWVFRDGPYRKLDDVVKWRSVYYEEEMPTDHTGEPYAWVTCPWCGKDLPSPPDDEGIEDPQADGC